MEHQLTHSQRLFVILWGLYMLLGMHYFQANLGGSGLELPINDISWMFLSVLIGIGLWQITIKKQICYNHFMSIVTVAILVMVFPILYANSVTAGESSSRLLGLIAGGLLLFSLLQMEFSQQQKRWIVFFILGGVVIEGLLSLYQYYFLPDQNWMGYSTLVNRPYGIFQQPNVSASFLTTGIALSLYLLVYSQALWQKFICFSVAFVATLPVILLLSRTGYLALIFAPLLVLPWVWQQTKKTPKAGVHIWLGCFSCALACGVISIEHATTVARDAAELTNPGGRIPIYLHSLQMFLDKPWLGWGYGSFEVNYLHSYSQGLNHGLALAGSPENLDHPHNELLYWAIEGGLVPLIGIALVTVAFILSIFKKTSLKSFAYLGLLFPIVLHTQTEYPFYHSVTHWAVFIVLVWYIVTEAEPPKIMMFQYTFFLRTFALLMPLLTCLYMATTLQTTSLLVQYVKTDPKDLTPLLKVVNPMSWITQLEFDVMGFRLQTALYKDDKVEYQKYINWAQDTVKKTPRANIYANWITVLEKLDRKKEAQTLIKQARIFYPQDKRFLVNLP